MTDNPGVVPDLYAAFTRIKAGGFPYARLVGAWGSFVEELGGMLDSEGACCGSSPRHRRKRNVALRAALV